MRYLLETNRPLQFLSVGDRLGLGENGACYVSLEMQVNDGNESEVLIETSAPVLVHTNVEVLL